MTARHSTLFRRLRSERGEGAIATIAGSVLFLFASVTVASFLMVSMGASALAQSNEQLTVALEADVQAWQRTAWSDLAPQAGTTNDTITAAGREYDVVRLIEFKPELSAWTMTVATSRAVAPGQNRADCAESLYTFVKGCVALSGSIVATADDIQPRTPAGITIASEDIDGTGLATNLITDPGFESGILQAWTGEGSATIADTTPRSSGTKALALNRAAPAGAYSNRIDVLAGDQLQAQAWVLSTGTSGALNITATFWDNGAPTEVPIKLVQPGEARGTWFSVTGSVNAPPGADFVSLTARLSDGATVCDAQCGFLIDDASFSMLRQNLAPNAGLENPAPAWSGASIVTAANPTASGTQVLELPGVSGRAESGSVPVTAGKYVAESLVHNAGLAGGTGTVSYMAVLPNGTDIPISIVPVSGIGTDWVRLSGTFDVPVSVTSIKLGILVGGAEATSKLHFDDFNIGRDAPAATDPSVSGYVRLASLDLAALTAKDLRLSFEYLGTGDGPTDLKLAVFCTAGAAASSVTESAVTRADVAGGGTWFWARVKIAAFDRLADCTNPDVRIYASGGNTPAASEIGNVSVLAVLPKPTITPEEG